MVCRIPILQFEQHYSTEAMIGIFPIFAIFSFLILKSSSRTCSCIQKSRTSLRVPLMSCFQSTRQRILRFSSIQCCHALNWRFRFRSVVPNLCHRISGTRFIGTTSNSQGSRQLAKCVAASVKSNLSWANKFAPYCVNLIQNQTLSSVTLCCVLIQ